MSVSKSKPLVAEYRDILADLPDMDAHLFRLVRQIPHGQVTTYGRLATYLGNPIASRWVGYRLLHHNHGSACSCHRVVRSDGRLGGFADMTAGAKARRLLNEGVEVLADRVDLNRTVFDQFTGDRPLLALHGLQDRLHTELQIGAPLAKPRFVAGVDVSYRGEMGSAALALYDLASHTIVRTVETSQIVRFPYITSYLAFRELPALLSVIESATQLGIEFDTLIVDGSGILHPRRCGIASMLGLACQIPSIGVTKKLLIGRIDKSEGTPRQPVIITVDGTNLGAALWARSTSTKRLFVSPGYHMDVTTAVAVVRQCLSGHRLPEPLYWADKRSRQAARTTGSDTTGSDVQNSELA